MLLKHWLFKKDVQNFKSVSYLQLVSISLTIKLTLPTLQTDLCFFAYEIRFFCLLPILSLPLACLQTGKMNFQNRRGQLSWQCFNPLQCSQNQPLYITYLGLRYLASRETAQKNKFPLKNTDRQCRFKTWIYLTEFEKLN